MVRSSSTEPAPFGSRSRTRRSTSSREDAGTASALCSQCRAYSTAPRSTPAAGGAPGPQKAVSSSLCEKPASVTLWLPSARNGRVSESSARIFGWNAPECLIGARR